MINPARALGQGGLEQVGAVGGEQERNIGVLAVLAGHPIVSSLGATVVGAVQAAAAAGMTALTLATMSDLAVLRPDPVTGLRAHRDFSPARRTPITAVSCRPRCWSGLK